MAAAAAAARVGATSKGPGEIVSGILTKGKKNPRRPGKDASTKTTSCERGWVGRQWVVARYEGFDRGPIIEGRDYMCVASIVLVGGHPARCALWMGCGVCSLSKCDRAAEGKERERVRWTCLCALFWRRHRCPFYMVDGLAGAAVRQRV